jgi:hypothetical protein
MTRLEDRQILVRDIEKACAEGARLAPACALAGINARTLRRWKAGDGLAQGDRGSRSEPRWHASLAGPMPSARFGMGLSPDSHRRDRLLPVSAFAMALLTVLGAVGESLGMDRQFKSNTSKTRSHFVVPAGLHALRTDPQLARAQAHPAHPERARDASLAQSKTSNTLAQVRRLGRTRGPMQAGGT